VVFWAVAATEPAGRPLADCELVPVTLELVDPDDSGVWERHATRALKSTRGYKIARKNLPILSINFLPLAVR